MSLSTTAIRNAKAKDKSYKLTDGRGLFLLINPRGGKGWRFKYRFDGKEKLLSFGTFPEIGLSDARTYREDARELVAKGIDPSAARKAAKAAKAESNANSFEVVAREWIGLQKNKWSPANTKVVTRQLENDIFPWIGKRPIAELKAPELLKVLRRMEERGVLDSAHRARTIAGQVFRYAIATGRTERDIAADLSGALAQPKKKHLPAITEPKKVAELLRAIDAFEGSLVVKCALRLAPLFFVRPGELRKAEWCEIDFDASEWNIPAEKMKMKQPHLVPLSTQAIEILSELQPLTGNGRYVFRGARSAARPLSDMALSAAIRRLGYEQGEMTPHGFRAMARTILDEVLQVRPDFIEHQLAHAVRDANGRAYNRTSHLAERRKMMQLWADYLDALKTGANVVQFHQQA